jgi:hypothetical protein
MAAAKQDEFGDDFGEGKDTEQDATDMASIIAEMKKKEARRERDARSQRLQQNLRDRPVIGVPVAEPAPAEDSNSVPSIPIPMATTAIPIMRQPSTGYKPRGGKSKRTRKRRRKRKTKRKKRKTKKRRRKRKRKTKKKRRR